MNNKLKIVATFVVMALMAFCGMAQAQAPADLSFLTNRAALASWAIKRVNMINVNVWHEATGNPEEGSKSVTRAFTYTGAPSLTAMARAISGSTFEIKTPVPGSMTYVNLGLYNLLPNGINQQLFRGFVGGRAEYDGTNWRLPSEQATPSMNLMGEIFIPASGVTAAWIVETNSWGWPYKRSLSVWQREGFYFRSVDAGEVNLCLEFANNGVSETEQCMYDLHSFGVKQSLSILSIKVSLRDSEDVRDFANNPTEMFHWLFTYKPVDGAKTLGVVPLLIANYTVTTTTRIKVSSAVGSARYYTVTRIGDNFKFTITVPAGSDSVLYTFPPGMYHSVPEGIDVSASWWEVTDGQENGGGLGTPVSAPQ